MPDLMDSADFNQRSSGKQQAIKSMVAAMKAMSDVQVSKTKYLTTMLEGSEKFRNNFLETVMKGQMDLQSKKAMMPINVQEDIYKKQTPTMNYKDQLFQEIRKKPQDQWESWEKQFVDTYTGGGEQEVIDPSTGQTLYTRPRKSVFKPKAGGGIADLFNDEKPKIQPAAQPSGRIRVKNKEGQTGTIEAGEFDPNLFEKI